MKKTRHTSEQIIRMLRQAEHQRCRWQPEATISIGSA
jgi:hypothetical protein